MFIKTEPQKKWVTNKANYLIKNNGEELSKIITQIDELIVPWWETILSSGWEYNLNFVVKHKKPVRSELLFESLAREIGTSKLDHENGFVT